MKKKNKKKPEAFAHSDGRTSRMLSAICHPCAPRRGGRAGRKARHVNGQWRDILMESLRKSQSERARERERPFGRTDGRGRNLAIKFEIKAGEFSEGKMLRRALNRSLD